MISTPRRLCLVLALCIVGAAMAMAPDQFASLWRIAVHEGLALGQRGLAAATRAGGKDLTAAHAGGNSIDSLERQLHASRRQVDRLQLQLAEARESRDVQSIEGAIPWQPRETKPLLVPRLVEARVLGSASSRLWRSRKLVGVGAAHGVVESALVLEDDGTLLDLGEDAELAAGDAVYGGRQVLGKVAQVGRFSSTVERITDAGYSGRARLVRNGPDGPVFGSEGTLTGDGGHLCRLRHIREPANPGDLVVTGGTDGLLPEPMLYGKVVKAQLEPGQTEWTIDVEPSASIDRFARVRILRFTFNSSRLLAD